MNDPATCPTCGDSGGLWYYDTYSLVHDDCDPNHD